jgi:hypothetical protein
MSLFKILVKIKGSTHTIGSAIAFIPDIVPLHKPKPKHMRHLLYLIAGLFFLLPAQAQYNASEAPVEYHKGDKVAAVIELPYPPDVVEDAIKEFLSKKGVKDSKYKGFSIFRSTRMYDSDLNVNDLHFKVERKSRKEKDVSVIYLLVGRPGENIGLRTKDDRYKVDDGKGFLNNMVPSIEAHNLEVDIKNQDETLKKAEKKMKNLQDEQKELEKKLETNRKEQEKQTEEISKQKTTLEALQGRRRS